MLSILPRAETQTRQAISAVERAALEKVRVIDSPGATSAEFGGMRARIVERSRIAKGRKDVL